MKYLGRMRPTAVMLMSAALLAFAIISWSETMITATVPADATMGPEKISGAGEAGSPGYVSVLWKAHDPANVALSAAAKDQRMPQLASDGSGGAIAVWQDRRSGTYAIYAQRVNSSGTVQWAADGIAVAAASGNQSYPQLIADGSGGAIITWQDMRSGKYDIYAQRINRNGIVQWGAGGVVISAADDDQMNPQLVPDGSGGAIITWMDSRRTATSDLDIYAQRVSGGGVVQWAANGVPISTAAGEQSYPQAASDGSGGAVIAWQDDRSGNFNVYAQRINDAGVVQWSADGVAVYAEAFVQAGEQLIADGAGGVIIAWSDYRNGSNADVYVQRLDSAGTPTWTAGGIAIAAGAGEQNVPRLVTDGSGGAIVTWDDHRGSDWNIYVQRVSGAGVVQWASGGLAVCAAAKDQYNPQIIADGSGGALIVWEDARSGVNDDIYAQSVNRLGMIEWPADGVPVSTAANFQTYPQLTSDGTGGAVITWEDTRGGSGSDIYAQVISAGWKESNYRKGRDQNDLLPRISRINTN